MDTPEMAAERMAYHSCPKTSLPPLVLKGDSLGSSTYWHGKLLTKWANDWVKLFTGSQGNFVMTNMEDNGTATALTRLAAMHRVEFQQVLFLRTASNYSMPPLDLPAVGGLSREHSGCLPSLDSAHRVGSIVFHERLSNWSKWQEHIPGE